MSDSPQHPRFSNPPSTVLYHAECADGFGAAWAIWKQYPDARFIPVKHGNPPPPDLKDQRVVIVDGDVPAGLIGNMHIVPLIGQGDQRAAHGDHIVIRMRTEQDDPFFGGFGAFGPVGIISIGLAAGPAGNGAL